MNHLSDYIEEARTALLKECGAFFAFSNQQFDEQKEAGVKYFSIGAGLLCPKSTWKELSKGLDALMKKGIKEDIAENGIDAIIQRELDNYEAFYTQDISDTVKALASYPISVDQIEAVFSKYARFHAA